MNLMVFGVGWGMGDGIGLCGPCNSMAEGGRTKKGRALENEEIGGNRDALHIKKIHIRLRLEYSVVP